MDDTNLGRVADRLEDRVLQKDLKKLEKWADRNLKLQGKQMQSPASGME